MPCIRLRCNVVASSRAAGARGSWPTAHAVLTRDPRECTGRFFIDDEVLAEEGVTDLSGYGGEDLVTDLFLDG